MAAGPSVHPRGSAWAPLLQRSLVGWARPDPAAVHRAGGETVAVRRRVPPSVSGRRPILVACVLTLGVLGSPAFAQPEPDAPPPENSDEPAGENASPEAAPGEAKSAPTGEAPSSAEETSEAPPAAELSPASATDQEAAAQAEAGRALYQAGNYVQALGAFRAAFEMTPTAALAYNVARCHERLSQWKEAIDWYQRYVELETDPRERADVLDKIALLQTRVGGDTSQDQFEARMMSGRQAYQRGDFEGAIEDFRAAFDLRQDPGPLYNIAKSYEKMARYEDALDYYRQYLDLAPNAPDRADVEAIMERLQRDLKARFQELSVASDPPGADIFLDDRNEGIVGQTNLTTRVRPGPHTLYIDLNGYEPIKRDFVMPDDKPLALEFSLEQLENVGYVTIEVDQPGARIFVDGAIVGLSPFTQKKALEAGEHQVQVELAGFNRYTETFQIERDETRAIQVRLPRYNPGVSDGTLTDWGRNLIIFGLVGGGLGFGGPLVYQELSVGRPYFDDLGPEAGNGRPFYDGQPASLRTNNERQTLETIQLVSVITGGTLVATGLALYMFKWLRKKPPPPVTAATPPTPRRPFEITGFGVAPTADDQGNTFGLSGRF